uniref:RING-type E3 ubiquitin transferase n=3 Tax=Rhizophora mucronata TaxID=61149 RepID=A0A2P2KRU4_RHIMU
MDDSCAVCADALEWAAYGPCSHRDVCSTCVARLRFICDDRRCCICKTECSVVFVTKALGDYTRMINDFSVFPSEPKEGRVGSYWYHEDTQAYFDDVDQYKMIKAMCRLSCSVCDKLEEEPKDGSKRRARFRNIEQLKGHLFHRHRLLMCSLCLEGRKVFICEQKLYTRSQLNQHISTGDSEVDGDETERGGFTGHPICEFCRTPFYGDNELYSHMNTDHYTCHICQRQHPGQYEYYKNYDDLEIHFQREHFLCEDEACLAKKFVVFPTEAEMKRHNTLEHGGRMSRSKRSAALQIPTSFRYRRGNEQDRRGRKQTFHRDESDSQLSLAIQASMETAQLEGTSHDQSSSSALVVPDHGNVDDIIPPFESLSAADSETSSRYLQALGQSSRNTPLEGLSFPPLPAASNTSQQKAKNEAEGLPNVTMAAHLRRQNNRNVSVVNSAQEWSVTSRGHLSNSMTSFRPKINHAPLASRGSASTPAISSLANFAHVQARSKAVHGHYTAGSPGNWCNTSQISTSVSLPNLAERGSSKPSISDFPPVSVTNLNRASPGSLPLLNVEDVQTANKSLVEKMRSALNYDEEKYASFKDISGQYRQGSVNTEEYLDYVWNYGLAHLVIELARLCPDAQRQKELIEAYNTRLRTNVSQENGCSHSTTHRKDNSRSKKGKKLVVESGTSNDRLADGILSTVRTLQSNYKPQEGEVEMLSKDGYRATKGKAGVMVDEQPLESRGPSNFASGEDGSSQSATDGGGGSKQRKKTSKFHRMRLGDGSMEALLNFKNPSPDPDPDPSPMENRSDNGNYPTGALPVQGVWRRGGGQKLFS